ncbi:developmentally-regulated GTP-binding protein 2 [Sphaeroforma arctica JP610]|uniref:Developmentally-regulated GTP-binding protein 2 n=1 Tax=Sphaeroforma arctica JP610 TaxID=667725 RepID=A0A0L0G9G4_9EUKA|nr:developmentally-regulated GTP-binding protein 2 [Sphaeroforma arctica JP610]KNC85630.1 developmentally-regulated GTP-binding protein 2 [Sphaeroforma arctica JP610]|eukprot:XP_014159532.1 developmentally-regulated GTP-binding protein 2 [Sphaeroforma arctica JP610]
MGVLEKIAEIELEMSRTQKNKATNYHLGLLKGKIARLRAELLAPSSKGPKGEGFDVMKSGDARVVMIGFPSVGKSTLLTKVTETTSEVAAYEFTTLSSVPGMYTYYTISLYIYATTFPSPLYHILIHTCLSCTTFPAQVVAVARTADMVMFMLDAMKGDVHKQLLEKELHDVGIRVNKQPPNIYLKVKKAGGIHYNATAKQTKGLDEKLTQMILQDYKMFNCEVILREDCDADDLIDVITGNRIYVPALYVYNKVDQITLEEVERLARMPHSLVISCHWDLNLDRLIERIWNNLNLVRVYTKRKGVAPDFDDGIILRNGATVEHVCHSIHRTLANDFKYALVWGKSAKFSPQRVGLSHKLEPDDVVQIVKVI